VLCQVRFRRGFSLSLFLSRARAREVIDAVQLNARNGLRNVFGYASRGAESLAIKRAIAETRRGRESMRKRKEEENILYTYKKMAGRGKNGSQRGIAGNGILIRART
jgi:hypothetical protein